MRSRLLPFLILVGAACGCASLHAFTDAPLEAPVEIPRSTPEQDYNAGVLLLERGDYDAARREWDRCVAMSAPDSDARVDCMVALEKLAVPGSLRE